MKKIIRSKKSSKSRLDHSRKNFLPSRSKWSGNANHPKSGSIISVEPIRELKDIESIKNQLAKQLRNLALFVLGINTNLRGIDLVRLSVGDVIDLKVGMDLILREQKTGKVRRIPLNRAVYTTLQAWLAQHPQGNVPEAPLFISRQGDKALTVSSLNRLVKKWCREAGLTGNYGCHSLRKTFGYQHRVHFGTDLSTLMVIFNHSNQRQTLTYLGIQEEEVRDAYRKEL